MKRTEQNRKANIWIARSVPVFTLGCVGYASWVLTKQLCVDYLLRPQPLVFTRTRPGPAIAILTVYYVLLCLMVICQARLMYTVTREPGLIPRNIKSDPEQGTERRRKRSNAEKNYGSDSSQDLKHSRSRQDAMETETLDVGLFWKRDVFECTYDGRPRFCSTCRNWKPDRAHHCSELDRCVLRMDHFCPWVGGVVGETSFKFFMQYTLWAALFCLHLLVSIAYYLAQQRRTLGTVNVHFAIILGMSGLFLLFAGGMWGSSLHLVFTNTTTIEQLNRHTKAWYFAIHIPEHRIQHVQNATEGELRLITYPRPASEEQQMIDEGSVNRPGAMPQSSNYAETQASTTPPIKEQRVFGIFEVRPGRSPWDLGVFENWCDLMGYTVWEWFLPVRRSPLTDHGSTQSFYKLGPEINRIKRKRGIIESRRRRESNATRSTD